MISVSNLGKAFGERTLFRNVSFQLDPGERYGLVGANGSGKTTLLGLLSGGAQPDEGSVQIPKGLRLGVLRQDHFLYEDTEILGVALMGNRELWDAMVEKERLLARAETDFDADRFSELEETVQRHDGYAAEARAATILDGLGIPAELHRRPISTLSGGFKLRVLLAQVLASAPDVLLLDEPTNHLDILSIRWLEKFLRDFAGPAVVISHDHRFLDNVSTRILDVDYETVTPYKGNYSDFVVAKREERERREKEIEGRAKEIAHHREFVDRFRAKASKARQAQSKLRLIEKKAAGLEALPGSSRRYPTFRFQPLRPPGRDVLRVEGVRKAYGKNGVLHGVDLRVRRGDRLAIIGPNGVGKSTLLRIAVGAVEPDAGEVEWGYEARPGYFAQDHREQVESSERTIEEWLWSFCPDRDRGFVRSRLGLMLFSGEEGKKRLSALSGGEAARLVFCRLGLENPNVLVLDEPTNHLDLEAIEALARALESYEGTLIFVSHDRWFVGRLATRVVEVRPDGIRDYHGTYEEYVHACGDDHLDADTVVLKARRERKADRNGTEREGGGGGTGRARGRARAGRSGRTPGASTAAGQSRRPSAGAEKSRRPSAAERQAWSRRRDEIASRIDEAEARVAEIEATFARPGYYAEAPAEEIAALDRERAALREETERLVEEWAGLEERLAEVG